MTGHLGETAGKNGRPELDAVRSLTLGELRAKITEAGGSEWAEIRLVFSTGGFCSVRIESDGKTGLGGGQDADRAFLRAVARLAVTP